MFLNLGSLAITIIVIKVVQRPQPLPLSDLITNESFIIFRFTSNYCERVRMEVDRLNRR